MILLSSKSNSKQPHVKVNLANLPKDPCLGKKFAIIILVIDTKFEEYIYK
jgi:hypothetical protein